MGKASAVLLSYRRIGNLPQILASVLSVPWVDDAVVWHNGPSLLHERQLGAAWDAERVTIINCPENKCTYGRYLAAQMCKHRPVIVQDDDVVVRNWDEILAAWEPESLVAALRPGHLKQDHRYHWGDAHEVLLGWGAMIDSRLVPEVFAPYLRKYGQQGLVLYRKADRLFTILHGRRHVVVEAKFRELPGANLDGIALYTLPDHEKLTHEARRRALGLLGIDYHG